MKKIWERIKRAGRKRLISGVVVVGLAAAGISLPEPGQLALVEGISAVIEVL